MASAAGIAGNKTALLNTRPLIDKENLIEILTSITVLEIIKLSSSQLQAYLQQEGALGYTSIGAAVLCHKRFEILKLLLPERENTEWGIRKRLFLIDEEYNKVFRSDPLTEAESYSYMFTRSHIEKLKIKASSEHQSRLNAMKQEAETLVQRIREKEEERSLLIIGAINDGDAETAVNLLKEGPISNQRREEALKLASSKGIDELTEILNDLEEFSKHHRALRIINAIENENPLKAKIMIKKGGSSISVKHRGEILLLAATKLYDRVVAPLLESGNISEENRKKAIQLLPTSKRENNIIHPPPSNASKILKDLLRLGNVTEDTREFVRSHPSIAGEVPQILLKTPASVGGGGGGS